MKKYNQNEEDAKGAFGLLGFFIIMALIVVILDEAGLKWISGLLLLMLGILFVVGIFLNSR